MSFWWLCGRCRPTLCSCRRDWASKAFTFQLNICISFPWSVYGKRTFANQTFFGFVVVRKQDENLH